MRDLSQRSDIGHIAKRIANRLAKYGFCFFVDMLGKTFGLTRIRKVHGDPLLWKCMRKKVVGATVKCAG